MTGKKKRALALMLAAGTAAAAVFPSYGDDEEEISSVVLRIESEIEVGDSGSDVSVTVTSDRYEADEAEVTNEPDDEWEDGDNPRIRVTLTAADGYYFESGLSKSDVTLRGDSATVSSVSRSRDELTVYVTLDDLEGDADDYDLEVYDLYWDEEDGTAYWEGADDAVRYEVRLYRGSSAVTEVRTTDNDSYSFAGDLTGAGTYTFRVRAVYSSSVKGDWEASDSWYLTSDEADELRENAVSYSSGSTLGGPGYSAQGAWLKDDVGWWYCNADKSYPASCWQLIDGKWYYFNDSGYMTTGWILWNDVWYYCGADGAMLTGTMTPDGYYVGADGAWIP